MESQSKVETRVLEKCNHTGCVRVASGCRYRFYSGILYDRVLGTIKFRSVLVLAPDNGVQDSSELAS